MGTELRPKEGVAPLFLWRKKVFFGVIVWESVFITLPFSLHVGASKCIFGLSPKRQ